MKEVELERKEALLELEIETLTNEVLGLKRSHRAEMDRLQIELQALKRYLAHRHGGFDKQFSAALEQARLAALPE